MTQQTINISEVYQEDRQRSNMGDLDNDFSSIKELGLIQPVVLEQTKSGYRLVAGGRRLAWLSVNGFTALYHGVTCDPTRPGYVLSGELTDLSRQETELYENIKRQSLTWQEECKAIARIHRARWIINKSEALEWSQKHTARLLGIGANAKVGYALQIADAIRSGDEAMKACESYTAAVRLLNERSEGEARKEQDRRRAIALEQDSPVLPGIEAPPQEPIGEQVVVKLSQMCYLGSFAKVAKDEVPSDTFPVALLMKQEVTTEDWKQVYRLLKKDSVAVWACGLPWVSKVGDKLDWRYLEYPVIWNILDEEPDLEVPFRNNQFHIHVLIKGEPSFPNASPTSIVSASIVPGITLPSTVIEFLLRAVSISGDSVLLPCGGPNGLIARLGRRPVTFDKDQEGYEASQSVLRTYYTELYGGRVEFK